MLKTRVVCSLLLLLLIDAANHVRCLEVEKVVFILKKLQWEDTTSPSQACLPPRSRREEGGAVLEIKHHSHCSSKAPVEDDLEKILISDEARISSLQSQIRIDILKGRKEKSLAAQIPLTSGMKLQTLNYIVTIKLGGQEKTVIMDTGSDLSWVQCKPCGSCYNQLDPLFDPSVSPSYQTIPCNSSTCTALQLATGTAGVCSTSAMNCRYELSYGDGSYSIGVLSKDRINLGGMIVENFIFGCGKSSRGLFGATSGLMGLGRTQLSLISQTSAQFGGVFSYCLPTRAYNSSGSLVLGNDLSLYRNTTPVSYTRMFADPQQAPFYFLNLTGLSIGGERLQSSWFSTGKVLIDSGTVITRLVPSVYKALKAEFVKQFSGYPTAPAFAILDTCFDLSGYEEVKVPTLKFEFEGDVEVNVDVTGILYVVRRDASQVCLAVTSLAYEDGIGIIGNFQQKNLRVVYDTAGSKLGFAKEMCGFDHVK